MSSKIPNQNVSKQKKIAQEMLWFLLLARFCRAVSLDNSTFREAEQGGWCSHVENLGTLESWTQEGSGSITKSRERS